MGGYVVEIVVEVKHKAMLISKARYTGS